MAFLYHTGEMPQKYDFFSNLHNITQKGNFYRQQLKAPNIIRASVHFEIHIFLFFAFRGLKIHLCIISEVVSMALVVNYRQSFQYVVWTNT